MAEGTAQRFVGIVLLFHGCEGLRSAKLAVELFHFILGRICLCAKKYPHSLLTFRNALAPGWYPVSARQADIAPFRAKPSIALRFQRHLCLKIISSIIPYSLA